MKYVPVVYFTCGILNTKKHCAMENDDSRSRKSQLYFMLYCFLLRTENTSLGDGCDKMHLSTTI